MPARIQIISAHQTRQDLNRMLEKPVQKWTGCPRTPLEPRRRTSRPETPIDTGNAQTEMGSFHYGLGWL